MSSYRKTSAREYWLIAALMAVVIVGIFGVAGGTLSHLFSLIDDRLSNATPG